MDERTMTLKGRRAGAGNTDLFKMLLIKIGKQRDDFPLFLG
jgi:hypothetical protein